MDRRLFCLAASGLMVQPTLAAAQTSDLVLATNARQGDVLRGRAAPGSTIRVGSLVAPFDVNDTGAFAIGLSRNAPASVTVTSSRTDAPDQVIELTVEQRQYLSVVISGTARSGADEESSAAPNSAYGMYRGLDLVEGGDAEIPQDASERSGVVASTARERETRAERLARETAAKQAAFASRLPLTGFLEEFQWPVRGPISSQWGAQRTIITRDGDQRPDRPHGGIDIRAITGVPIAAPASGVVVLADPDFFYEGGVVFVDHGQGLISLYLHMSAVSVAVGDAVTQGQQLGLVGSSGRATGPHLCWRMKWRGVDVDPTSLLPAAERT